MHPETDYCGLFGNTVMRRVQAENNLSNSERSEFSNFSLLENSNSNFLLLLSLIGILFTVGNTASSFRM